MAILEHAASSGRYSAAEVGELAFDGALPDPAELSRKWKSLLDAACQIVAVLPAEQVGTCVLTRRGALFTGNGKEAEQALACGELMFHAGRFKGAYPRIVSR